MPKHAVTGYWQNFNNGATVQKICATSRRSTTSSRCPSPTPRRTPGAVTFNLDSAGLGGYTVAQFKADIAAKQAAGKTVIISIGGEKRHDLRERLGLGDELRQLRRTR